MPSKLSPRSCLDEGPTGVFVYVGVQGVLHDVSARSRGHKNLLCKKLRQVVRDTRVIGGGGWAIARIRKKGAGYTFATLLRFACNELFEPSGGRLHEPLPQEAPLLSRQR